MKEQMNQVLEFHKTYGVNVNEKPTLISGDRSALRFIIQLEELEEYADACESENLVEVVDSIIDQLYILFGTAHEHGLSAELLTECFNEVHRSNMSKLDENGKPVYREDGKVIKGENYSAPNLKPIIDKFLNQ